MKMILYSTSEQLIFSSSSEGLSSTITLLLSLKTLAGAETEAGRADIGWSRVLLKTVLSRKMVMCYWCLWTRGGWRHRVWIFEITLTEWLSVPGAGRFWTLRHWSFSSSIMLKAKFFHSSRNADSRYGCSYLGLFCGMLFGSAARVFSVCLFSLLMWWTCVEGQSHLKSER